MLLLLLLMRHPQLDSNLTCSSPLLYRVFEQIPDKYCTQIGGEHKANLKQHFALRAQICRSEDI